MRFRKTGTAKSLKNDATITHYRFPKFPNETNILNNTTVDEYVWCAGDRYSSIAFKYYGDVRFWWVIAWFNKKPMDFMMQPGDVVVIPRNIDYIVGEF